MLYLRRQGSRSYVVRLGTNSDNNSNDGACSAWTRRKLREHLQGLRFKAAEKKFFAGWGKAWDDG